MVNRADRDTEPNRCEEAMAEAGVESTSATTDPIIKPGVQALVAA